VSSDLLVSEKLDLIIRHAGTPVGNEVLQHRGDNERRGGKQRDVGVKHSLLGAPDKLEITARKATGTDGALKIAVNIRGPDEDVGHDED